MLKNWRVINFKSLRDTKDVEFPGVTVFAGANSSGKSSFIQSILLLKQTIQYGPESRALSLNGPILKLGSFEDICRYDAEEKEITIEFEFDLHGVNSLWANEDWLRMLRHLVMDDISSFKVSIKFKEEIPEQSIFDILGEKPPNLVPKLDKVSISVRHKKGEKIHVVETSLSAIEGEKEYSVGIDPADLEILSNNKKSVAIEKAWVSHFLPSWGWVTYSSTYSNALQARDFLLSDNSLLTNFQKAPDGVPGPQLMQALFEYLKNKGGDDTNLDGSNYELLKSSLRRCLSSSVFQAKTTGIFGRLRIGGAITSELGEIIVESYVADNEERTETHPEYIPSLEKLTPFIKSYFKEGIRYIGPLRDAPKPVYQPEALENTTGVGYRGEHTAAVLDINKDRLIENIQPPDADGIFKGVCIEQRFIPLNEAVLIWLKYLEVAENIETSDAGVYGNRLQISPRGTDRLHDLTNVGVGVSQVLPIVVSSILAPNGSTLIFEQPELHLHPRVQARLADFFLALSLNGRKVLIETHSEYLVDRIRLRVAQSPQDDLLKKISILFSSKPSSSTKLEKIQVNKYGAIKNWPDDFFDQSQTDVSRIIKAASIKKKRSIEGS